MIKEQVSNMSTTDLEQFCQNYRNKIAQMKVLNAQDLEIYALCEAELKLRKGNGNS